jgi:hypothetical protein
MYSRGSSTFLLKAVLLDKCAPSLRPKFILKIVDVGFGVEKVVLGWVAFSPLRPVYPFKAQWFLYVPNALPY